MFKLHLSRRRTRLCSSSKAAGIFNWSSFAGLLDTCGSFRFRSLLRLIQIHEQSTGQWIRKVVPAGRKWIRYSP
ncbi:hypothetical protein BD410DRAFT_286988 [Rickenella mellea]|uniref:Uncharacterized protein n=1 Tax=Rickenella mellea TaxID=50990 RepID=A0A4Y7Q2M0_9AGAM|nr:hypothetical protein BD410DRAFT_286988 [Rickenella mellea]